MNYTLQLVGVLSSFSGTLSYQSSPGFVRYQYLPISSLTLEASLREVTSLRQQILRIKGENSVSCLRPPHLYETQ